MKGFKEIKPQPGYWIDWNGKGGPVIRDGHGILIATDLHITEADAAKLKERVIEELKQNPPPWLKQ